jgi:putative ABC transport system permease protein
MGTIWQDLRYGARMLWKSPGFTAVAAVALALGVGANTAIFSVVHALMLRELPYRDADRLAMVWEHNRPRDRRQNVINPANFLDWKARNTVFEDMAAFVDTRANLTGSGDPVEVARQLATPNLFPLLGVQPLMGRALTEEDARADAPPVVFISYPFWQSRFGGDPSVLGKTLTLDGQAATIVGVAPAGFNWLIKQGSLTGTQPDLWAPYSFPPQTARRGRFMMAVGRLKEGVTRERAQAEMSAVAAQLEEENVDFNKGWGVEVIPLREQFTGPISTALWVLLGAVLFLLLIACANVANLLLARAAGRQREIAIRTALGAGRGRVVRQLLTESVLLSMVGGAAGLLLAWWGVETLTALAPRDLTDLGGVRLNLPVLGFTFAVSLLTGVVFGLAPAFEATRVNTNESLKDGGRGSTGGARIRRLRAAFVTAEVALALVLLVGAGLLVRSFATLRSVDPGFRAENVLTMRVALPSGKYAEAPRRTAFFRETTERIRQLPGVESAGAVSFLPFAGLGAATRFTIVEQPVPPPGQDWTTDVRVADAAYFQTMGIPLLRGRTFGEHEMTEARHVVLINEAMARKHFPNEDPLGKRLVVSMSATPVPTEVVGVVGDVKLMSLDGESRPTVYWPHPELAYGSMTVVVRTKGDPQALAGPARQAIQALDPEQPVADVRTMEEWISASVARARFSTTLLGVFATVALFLAVAGIYAVISYTVAQRTHEIGIRMALGARGRDIVRMVVRQGMLLALAGVVIGTLGALLLTRVISGLLFGVSATDPVTFAAVALVLGVVALLACYVPARRASRVDPMEALRYE